MAGDSGTQCVPKLQRVDLLLGNQDAHGHCWRFAEQAGWMNYSLAHCRPGLQSLQDMAACECHDESHTHPVSAKAASTSIMFKPETKLEFFVLEAEVGIKVGLTLDSVS